MIIKKLGALLLTAIIALTLVITPVISATHHNVHPPDKIHTSPTKLQPLFSEIFADFTHLKYRDVLYSHEGVPLSCKIKLYKLNKKGKWITFGSNDKPPYTPPPIYRPPSIYTPPSIDKFPIYVYLLQDGKTIFKKKTVPNTIFAWVKFPELNKGNYTLKFIYHGSQKYKLLPSNTSVSLCVY